MLALAVPTAGSPAAVIEIDTPTAGPGEVLVRVLAASINGFDTMVAAGYLAGMMEHRYPVVIGKDFAGVVAALGEGVQGYAVGDRVFGVVTKDFLGDGSIGEYVTVPAVVGIALTPEVVTDQEAAALGLAGVTALGAIASSELGPDSVVLVSGATGGVGTQVLQRALATGATVIATAKGEAGTALVTDLGANLVIDYSSEDVAAAVRAAYPAGADVIVHLAGDPAALLPALADGGRFVSALLMSADDLAVENGTVHPVYAVPTSEALDTVSAGLADGSVSVTVDRVYPLAEAADALAQFGAGKLGKIVVTTV